MRLVLRISEVYKGRVTTGRRGRKRGFLHGIQNSASPGNWQFGGNTRLKNMGSDVSRAHLTRQFLYTPEVVFDWLAS